MEWTAWACSKAEGGCTAGLSHRDNMHLQIYALRLGSCSSSFQHRIKSVRTKCLNHKTNMAVRHRYVHTDDTYSIQ